jgi:hypothetical protein
MLPGHAYSREPSFHPVPPPTRVTRIFGSRAQHVRGSELGFFWSLTSQSNSRPDPVALGYELPTWFL